MMAQYSAAKREHPDALLFFRMGDFYELFFDDAKEASRLLSLTLTSRSKGEGAVPMAGVPARAVDGYLKRLVQAGRRVAICEQVQDPRDAKGLVDRRVVRVVTAGTLTEEEMLQPGQQNFLAAVLPGRERAGIAWLDLSTGTFLVTEVPAARLTDELHRIEPAELLAPEGRRELLPREVALVAGTATWRPDFAFDPEAAFRALTGFFRVASLEGFGVQEMPLAVGAAGALIGYVQETQKTALPHIRKLEVWQRGGRMFLDRATRQSLELCATLREGKTDHTLLAVLDRTRTPMGARLLRDWLLAPLLELAEIHRRQEAVAELCQGDVLRDTLATALGAVLDLPRLVAKISCGRANARDLVGLKDSLLRVPEIKGALQPAAGTGARPVQSPRLLDIGQRLDALDDVVREVGGCLVDVPPLPLTEGGLVREGFDASLDELRGLGREAKDWMARFQEKEIARTGIPGLKVGFNKVFGYYIEITHAGAGAGTIPANDLRKQTVKNAERYVTPELKEFETRALKSEELSREMEYNIFVSLREAVAARTGRILETAGLLAELDALLSFALVAREGRYVRPVVDDSDDLMILDGRHPVIERVRGSEGFVPNDTQFAAAAARIAILTGPNMAGKSTYIRQVALITLLAQCGAFVPAREARIGLVDRIFTRVGSADDIGRGQSTFMVEMTETANILNNATRRSLVILDEVGRGTSTYDGLALAWALCEELHDRISCRTLFATHYHQMTEMATTRPGIKNQHVAVSEWGEEIVFLHKIVDGGTDKSYGLHVARLAGIPGTVIGRAREVLAEIEDEASGMAPRLGRGKRPARKQMTLFKPPELELLELVRALDPERMTPMDALVKLQEIVKRFRKG